MKDSAEMLEKTFQYLEGLHLQEGLSPGGTSLSAAMAKAAWP
jgi:hypothetical protein